jgi:hypothetical protein
MKIAAAAVTDPDAGRAARDCYSRIADELGGPPSLLLAHASVENDVPAIARVLAELAPGTCIHGATSCKGVMTRDGFFGYEGRGIGFWALRDEAGTYGTGMAEIGENPGDAGAESILAALEDAGRPGETPHLIWLTAAPGQEEAILAGIEGVVGHGVPIAGGSAADNTVSGDWLLFSGGVTSSNAVVASVFFPSVDLSFSFHSGYTPTSTKGVATKVHGRTILELDARPAAQVYDEWTGGSISGTLGAGGSVLELTTLHPLGRVVGNVGGSPYFQLSHPESVGVDGSMSLFTNIDQGDELVLMAGSLDSLITRAARVTQAAMDNAFMEEKDLSGALLTYCAGCMLTVGDQMDRVSESLARLLVTTPFLGLFTFGEQGCFIGGENRHGNLMISAVVFGQ